MPEDEPVLIGERIAEGLPYSDAGEFLHGPGGVALKGDTVVVSDSRNDRIVFFDRDLRYLAPIGREGEGPGEFRGPMGVIVTADAIVVAELTNARFTVLDRAGGFVRTLAPVTVPGAYSFGMLADGSVVVPDQSDTHFATHLTQDGATLFGARPPEAGILIPHLATTRGDTVHVYDEDSRTLYRFTPAGVLVTSLRIPRALADSLAAYTTAVSRSFGGTRTGASIKHLRVTSDGSLLLVLSAGRTVGLLVDPHTYRARRLVIPENAGAWASLPAAVDMEIGGDRLYALSGEHAYAYVLPRDARSR